MSAQKNKEIVLVPLDVTSCIGVAMIQMCLAPSGTVTL